MRELATERWGAIGLVQAYWWVESGYRRPWGWCPCTGGYSPVLGLELSPWQSELGPGLWLQGPGFPAGGWAQFLTQLAAGCMVSWSLCWPASV